MTPNAKGRRHGGKRHQIRNIKRLGEGPQGRGQAHPSGPQSPANAGRFPLGGRGLCPKNTSPRAPAPKKEVTEVVSEVVAPAPVVQLEPVPAEPAPVAAAPPASVPGPGPGPTPAAFLAPAAAPAVATPPQAYPAPGPGPGPGPGSFPASPAIQPIRAPDQTWPGWPSKSGGWRIRNGV